jgi:hypothetical protein
MPGFFVSVVEWVAGLEPWQQVGALLLVGAIPFIESYWGSLVGVVLGINPFLAVPAVIIGNILCTFLLIAIAGRVRTAATRNRQGESAEQPSKRRQKVARYLQRFGVPGVCLLGPIVLASQILGPALVGLGANRRSVYIWTGISITVWGVLTGFLWVGILGAADYEYLDY